MITRFIGGLLLALLAVVPSSAVPPERVAPWDVGLSVADHDGSLIVLGAIPAPRPVVHLPISGIWRDTARKSPLKLRVRSWFAIQLMNSGQLDEALTEFGALYQLAAGGDYPEKDRQMAILNAETNASLVMLKQGRLQDAESFLRDAWLRDPGFPGFAVGLTYFDIQRGKLDEAIAIATDGIHGMTLYASTNPEPFFAGKLYLNRGMAYLMSGKCSEALKDFTKARTYPDIPQTPNC